MFIWDLDSICIRILPQHKKKLFSQRKYMHCMRKGNWSSVTCSKYIVITELWNPTLTVPELCHWFIGVRYSLHVLTSQFSGPQCHMAKSINGNLPGMKCSSCLALLSLSLHVVHIRKKEKSQPTETGGRNLAKKMQLSKLELWPGLLYKGCQGKHDKQNQSQPWFHIFTVSFFLISPKSFLLLFSLDLAKCSNFKKTEVIESFHCKLLSQTGQASSGVTITSCETEQVQKTDFLRDKCLLASCI